MTTFMGFVLGLVVGAIVTVVLALTLVSPHASPLWWAGACVGIDLVFGCCGALVGNRVAA